MSTLFLYKKRILLKNGRPLNTKKTGKNRRKINFFKSIFSSSHIGFWRKSIRGIMKTMMVLWKVWLIWAQQIRIKAHQYIDPAEAAMVTEEVAPNDFVRYDVNLEQTHVWMCALAALWNRMQTRYFGVGEVSRTIGGKEWWKHGSRCVSRSARAFCRSATKPYFLAEVFIQAANDLKTNRIKLPCESTYVFDVNKYPPKPLPKELGEGAPHENRFENAPAADTKRCGICGQRGHNQLTCEYYEVWFDWNDPNDMVFRNLFSHALNRTGTALARLDNFCDFTSKPAKNQGKWRKTRETSRCNFLKKSR